MAPSSGVPRVVTGAAYVDYIVPTLAAFLGGALVGWVLDLSEQVALLLLLTVQIYVIIRAMKEMIEWVARLNDGQVDGYEHVFIYVFDLVAVVLFFMLPPYIYHYVSRALGDYALPEWYELCALAAVFIVILLAVLPATVTSAVAAISSISTRVAPAPAASASAAKEAPMVAAVINAPLMTLM